MAVVLDSVEITGDDGHDDGAEHDDAEDDQGAGGHPVVQKAHNGQPPEPELRGLAKLVRPDAGLCQVALLLDGSLDRELGDAAG